MQSRLIGVLASGALLLTVAAPSMAATPNPDIDNGSGGDTTTVTVYVDAGTTLYVPAAVSINLAGTDNAWPGQTVNNKSGTLASNPKIEWWSNEAEKDVMASMPDLIGKVGGKLIDDLNVHLWNVAPDGVTPADTGVATDQGSFDTAGAISVGNIDEVSGGTDETLDTQFFYLEVFIPSATEDQYEADITWTVAVPIS